MKVNHVYVGIHLNHTIGKTPTPQKTKIILDGYLLQLNVDSYL